MNEGYNIEEAQDIHTPQEQGGVDLTQENLEKPHEVSEKTIVDLKKRLSEKLDMVDDDETLDMKTLKEEEQKVLVHFIDALLAEKQHFSKVFQTENGSLYFVSKEGQSWRFRKEKEGGFREMPILNKVVFLSPEEKERFLELSRNTFFQEYLTAYQGNSEWIPEDQRKPYTITKSAFEEGNFPLEIGACHLAEVIFNETENSIEVVGVRKHDGSVDRCFASGIHLGHAISKIYKS